jgi:hypothetical protein
VQLTFSGEVFHWRGPAPHHWVAVPDEDSEELAARPELSYGWGCIPAVVSVGGTRFETSLMPKDGRYLVPIKVAVRRAEGIELGDTIAVSVRIGE